MKPLQRLQCEQALRENLVHILVHDLKSPLTGLMGFLDVARLEGGHLQLGLRECRLIDLARWMDDTLFTEARHVQFEVRQRGVERPVICDSDMVQRVLENLVANAMKFASEDGRGVQVSVDYTGPAVRVEVTDEGPGIPASRREWIFEKYAQASRDRDRRSSGMGLTFCKMAVEAHQGPIGVESTEGRGSTFWFELPPDGPLLG